MGIPTSRPHLIILFILPFIQESLSGWEEWWTYDGISGPGFWGLINPQWGLCSKGRRQSPVNIDPTLLLFDPWLRPVHIDRHKISGSLHNTGQSLVLRVDPDSKQHVNISGGPLAYRYQLSEGYIHYGMKDGEGSEHRVQNYVFPGEIQLYGFNAELYHNMSEAQHKSQGIVGISLMLQIGDTPNPELRVITSSFNKVLYKGNSTPIRHLSIRNLLPETDKYMTYEGSTTHPGCWETAIWLVFNKPIYITKQELYALRKLMQGSPETPKAPLGNNARPPQQLYHRTVRTNIDFNREPDLATSCPSPRPLSLVVGGKPACKGQFPFQVAVVFYRESGSVARGGGSILSPSWVLTAAHLCKDAKKGSVYAGAYPTARDAQQSCQVDMVVMQDAFRIDSFFSPFILHDIALLHLNTPLRFGECVKAVHLPSAAEQKKHFANESAILIGWGKTCEADIRPYDGSAKLNFALETILSNEQAAKMLNVDCVPNQLLAAIGTDGKACSCNGDSGGPLVIRNERGKYTLVGIVSHRVGPCGGPLPHLLTRVTSYLDWIKKVMTTLNKPPKK